jgi:hypothetical protein
LAMHSSAIAAAEASLSVGRFAQSPGDETVDCESALQQCQEIPDKSLLCGRCGRRDVASKIFDQPNVRRCFRN